MQIAGFSVGLALVTLAIAGCGGGGGGGNGDAVATTPPPTAGTPTGPLTGPLRQTSLPPPTDLSATPANLNSFVAFESGQVRPLALNATGDRLLAVNTPDNRLEMFSTVGDELTHLQSIPVGMEPVAVAVRGNEAWVVNHLSDSVSVVDFSLTPARVINTLLVGDEPRDIVFAGPDFARAFITTAHRGQNSPVDPQLTTPGIGRADVWVFDALAPGTNLGGTPLAIVELFGDTPRALAATPDGSRVYAAVFNSGNRTTVVRDVPTLSKAPPFENVDGEAAPLSALILRFDGTAWVDEQGTNFNARAALNLPDLDVFEIDAMAASPQETRSWSGVGTTLFNMAVNPSNGNVFVSNTEARNHIRFEGFGGNASTVRGNLAQNRVSVLTNNGDVLPVHLNDHVDRSREVGTAEERALSLASPLEMAFTADGSTVYLVAMGSNKLAAIDSAELESGSFDAASATHITVSGGGPTGVVLNEATHRAYVLTRFDNGISTINLQDNTEIAHTQMFNPEPASITVGRPFLYDANLTSSTGESSCASCHIFGDTDQLAWDLGNPDEAAKVNPFNVVPFTTPPTGQFNVRSPTFHPMKGPKATQSLRGMPNHGPLHWRGDRTGQNPVGGETLEEAAFKEFNGAFRTLMGRETELDDDQMQAFTDFAMQLAYPPNPHRPLDNVLTPDLAEGRRVYTNVFTSLGDGQVGCNTCHVLDAPNGNFGSAKSLTAVLGANEQDFKVPHFRNIYQKVGFFRGGLAQPQIRGFGLSEPGSTAGLLSLINSGDFQFETNEQPNQLAAFIFAFDTLLAPVVGQQVTLSSTSPAAATIRVDFLVARAAIAGPLPQCDLIAKGVWGNESRGALRLDSGEFQTDRPAETLSLQALKDLGAQPGNHITFTCAPPNSGLRMAIDRNEDGILDLD
ncbi:MAG: hypothetical protein AAFN78_01575 [Pseudomonadota bacterium]